MYVYILSPSQAGNIWIKVLLGIALFQFHLFPCLPHSLSFPFFAPLYSLSNLPTFCRQSACFVPFMTRMCHHRRTEHCYVAANIHEDYFHCTWFTCPCIKLTVLFTVRVVWVIQTFRLCTLLFQLKILIRSWSLAWWTDFVLWAL